MMIVHKKETRKEGSKGRQDNSNNSTLTGKVLLLGTEYILLIP